MEKTKRLITLLLAVLCALALCVPAFAADVTVITDMKTDCLVDASGSFLLLSLVLTLVVVAILQKPLGKYLRAEDLQK